MTESTEQTTPTNGGGLASLKLAQLQALASQLDDGHLLTWEGQGHTAYGRAGDCISRAVDSYLLAGQLPEEGLTCAADK